MSCVGRRRASIAAQLDRAPSPPCRERNRRAPESPPMRFRRSALARPWPPSRLSARRNRRRSAALRTLRPSHAGRAEEMRRSSPPCSDVDTRDRPGARGRHAVETPRAGVGATRSNGLLDRRGLSKCGGPRRARRRTTSRRRSGSCSSARTASSGSSLLRAAARGGAGGAEHPAHGDRDDHLVRSSTTTSTTRAASTPRSTTPTARWWRPSASGDGGSGCSRGRTRGSTSSARCLVVKAPHARACTRTRC